MSGPKTPASPNSSAPSVTVQAATAATPSVTVTAAPTPAATPSVKVTTAVPTAATSASVQATPPAAAGIQLAVVQDDPDNELDIEATNGDSELGLTAEEEQIQPLEKIKKLKPLEKYKNENGGIGDKIGEFLLNLIKLWQNRPLYKENGVIENENIKIEENNNKIQAKNNRIFKNLKGKTEEDKLNNLSEEQQELYKANKKTAEENEKTIKENNEARGATLKEQEEAIAGTMPRVFVAKLKGLLRPSPPAPGAAPLPPDPNQTVPLNSAATTPRSNPGGRSPLADATAEFTNLQGVADNLPVSPTGRPVDYMRQAAARAASYLTDPTMPNDNRDSLAQTNRSPRSPR